MSQNHSRPNLYFAYGSNLNEADWQRWCEKEGFPPGLLKFRSRGYLPDWDIAFDRRSNTRGGGVLNIRPRKGQAVPGVIFEVQELGWKALDRKEGAPRAYHFLETTAFDEGGQPIGVGTYMAPQGDDFVEPAEGYADIVRKGMETYGVDTPLFDAAVKGELTPWLTDANFCYGTLMRGESRFPILAQFEPTCMLLAETSGRLLNLGNYPGLIAALSNDQTVQGEFVRLTRFGPAIEMLDSVEGFRGYDHDSSLFQRALVTVNLGEGRLRLAWEYVYYGRKDRAKIIESGCWRTHHRRRDLLLTQLVAQHAASAGGPRKLDRRLRDQDLWGDRSISVSVLDAFRDGELSERRLAHASGRWYVVPNVDFNPN